MDFIKWAKSQKLPSALESREGWAKLFEYYRSKEPHIHQIEPTNHCPYSCIMCPRSTMMSRNPGFMKMEVFRKIIDEISTYNEAVKQKEIELFHFGESLLHSDLPKMVDYMNSHALKSTLSINPSSLNENIIEQLAVSRPSKIIVSIDSMKSERLKKIRGKHANVDRAVDNTIELLSSFKGKEANTEIIIRMIVMNENQEEKDEFGYFWQQAGAKVEFRDFFPWNISELRDLGVVEKYPPFMPCPFPWQYLVVQWNGDVVACCRDYNGRIKLGNVAKESLTDIWNGEKCIKLRHSMATGKGLLDMCDECLGIYYTET